MAGFLDFLIRPKANAPAVSIEDLEGKLAELRESRERSNAFLASIESRRAKLMIDDADPAKIIALDIEADSARISLEKSDVFEGELLTRLAALHGDAAEQAWREAYDQMHEAALEYAGSMRASLQSLYEYRAASEHLGSVLECAAPKPLRPSLAPKFSKTGFETLKLITISNYRAGLGKVHEVWPRRSSALGQSRRRGFAGCISRAADDLERNV
jgi:hypothetical protein